MRNALIVVDIQQCFLNGFTRHIPGRVATLIEQNDFDPIFFTRFINSPESPYRRFMDWHGGAVGPDTDLAPELHPWATKSLTYDKQGYAGIPSLLEDELRAREIDSTHVVGIDTDMCVLKVAMDLFDLNIEPLVLVDCCASTAGLQSHLAGLAVLARNIGAQQLRDAGLSEGHLAAP